MARNPLPNTQQLAQDLSSGDRIALGRAITLIESTHPKHQDAAEKLLEHVLPKTGNSIRVGITGTPGVGKSTFIEAFGLYLIEQGRKVAVLTVDPTSSVTSGSILGDKTRMNDLSNNKSAFIRPSPAGDSLGGVNRRTRETIYLSEAAGFDVIIVETVGVGQSETEVKEMVDFFLLLSLAGGGDELQGIKRGIMEMADAVVINKADGDNKHKSKLTAKSYEQALHLFPPTLSGWRVPVTTCSALEKLGLEDVWSYILDFEQLTKANKFFHQNRSKQNVSWFQREWRTYLESLFVLERNRKNIIGQLEKSVLKGEMSVRAAINQLKIS